MDSYDEFDILQIHERSCQPENSIGKEILIASNVLMKSPGLNVRRTEGWPLEARDKRSYAGNLENLVPENRTLDQPQPKEKIEEDVADASYVLSGRNLHDSTD